MSSPFRDDLGDAAAAAQFAQHIGIAEDFLAQIEDIPKRIDAFERGDGITQGLMDQLAHQWMKGWENVWDHLGQARQIVAAKGRDVSAFDAARVAAGDLYVGAAIGKAVSVGREVTVTWQNVPTTTAKDAIAALRSAMPEVVVSQLPPLEVDLRPASNKVLEGLYVVAALGGLGLFAYFVYRVIQG